MTKREKQFVLTGMLIGMVVAAVLYLVSRRLHDSRAGDLNLVVGAQAQGSEPAPSSSVSESASGEAVSTLQLNDQEQQQIGVQTAKVEHRNLRRTLSAVALVEQPETELATVSARVSGRIDKLFVDFTGQPVRRGQEIALIYSPEIFSTAEEYRLALENRKRLGSGAEPQAVSGAEDLVAAARRRLELWELTTQQIDEIASSPKPQIDLPIYSPANGIVTERKVTEGQYVNAGESLYTLSDLSTVWVASDVPESDIRFIEPGERLDVDLTAYPGETFRARVMRIADTVDPITRTVKV